MTDSDEKNPVGSLGEEALKLLQALQDRARESGQESGEAAARAATAASGFIQNAHEHVATGAPECSFCPLCQLISAFRNTSPEVRNHLAAAGSSLLQAAAGVLATTVPDRTSGEAREWVERIDLSDTDEWEED